MKDGSLSCSSLPTLAICFFDLRHIKDIHLSLRTTSVPWKYVAFGIVNQLKFQREKAFSGPILLAIGFY